MARNDMLWGAVTLILSFGTRPFCMYSCQALGSIPLAGQARAQDAMGDEDSDGFLAPWA